jgi:hypothetical protein
MAQALLSLSRVAAPREPLEGSEIVEAREALEYWSRRAVRLPWHRRAARREAREMAARWRARLIGRHLDRWRLGWLERVLLPVFDTRGRSGGARIRSLAWTSMRRTAIGRRIIFVASFVVVASAASFVLLLAIAAHLAGV